MKHLYNNSLLGGQRNGIVVCVLGMSPQLRTLMSVVLIVAVLFISIAMVWSEYPRILQYGYVIIVSMFKITVSHGKETNLYV